MSAMLEVCELILSMILPDFHQLGLLWLTDYTMMMMTRVGVVFSCSTQTLPGDLFSSSAVCSAASQGYVMKLWSHWACSVCKPYITSVSALWSDLWRFRNMSNIKKKLWLQVFRVMEITWGREGRERPHHCHRDTHWCLGLKWACLHCCLKVRSCDKS